MTPMAGRGSTSISLGDQAQRAEHVVGGAAVAVGLKMYLKRTYFV
jgi:hypothetical protein